MGCGLSRTHSTLEALVSHRNARTTFQGRLLIVAPDDTCGVSTLTRDKGKLLALYEKGVQDGAQIRAFVSE